MRGGRVIGVAALILAGLAAWWGLRPSSERAERRADGGEGARARREPARQREPPATGSIEGAVRDPTGAAVPSARVCAAAASKAYEDNPGDPICADAGLDGRYRLTGLSPASYRVGAAAPRHWAGEHRSPKGNPRVGIGPGEHRRGVDILLQPGGVEVSGTVLDIGGGPVAGAWVKATSPGARGAAQTISQRDGAFRLWLAPGDVHLIAHADGYADDDATAVAPAEGIEILLTPASILAGRVIEAGTGAPVPGARVSASESGTGPRAVSTDEQGVFRLTDLPPGRYKPIALAPAGFGQARASVLLGVGQTVDDLTIELHPAATVRGRVVTDTGADCDLGLVTLTDAKAQKRRRARVEAGRVDIEAVLPGTYDVYVQCVGYADEAENPAIAVEPGANPPDQRWRVSAAGRIRGAIHTAQGAPVARADIRIEPASNQNFFRDSAHTVSEPDGTFAIEGVRAGTYRLTVDPRGHPAPRGPLQIAVPTRGEASVDIRLDAGGDIEGDVVDERGRPQAGIRIYAVTTPPAGDGRALQSRDTRTGADGRFTITGLTPGTYRISAEDERGDEELRASGQPDARPAGASVEVTADRAARAHLVVENRAAIIRGRVVDASGTPITDAFVDAQRESAYPGEAGRTLRQGWWRRPVLTDPTGDFEIQRLPVGNYTIRAFRRGGGDALAEGIATGSRVTLTIRPTGSLRGTVKTANGAPPERFTLHLRNPKTGLERRESFHRTQGSFEIRDLPAGSFVLSAIAAEGKGRTDVVLTHGQELTNIVVELAAAARATGRIVAADDGAPLTGMAVSIRPDPDDKAGPPPSHEDPITGPDGHFTIENAPVGRVRVIVYPFSRAAHQDSTDHHAVIEPGQTNNLGDLPVPKKPEPRTGE